MNNDNIPALAKLLGTERTEELKDHLLERLKDDIDDVFKNNWCIGPELIKAAVQEIYEECLEEAKRRICCKVTGRIEESILLEMQKGIK